jgi:CubicO group peptidase (beta-lactamase class C family)
MSHMREDRPVGLTLSGRWFGVFLLVCGGIAMLSAPLAGRATGWVDPARVDAVFAKWTSKTPGCAVGVSVGGKIVIEKAYGMADLEHDVRNSPQTIFEAGSVSKQFTAAAMLLLAREGKLSLDDQARKYIPELPDYGHSLTIRHLLQHTSGLRDWGEIENIAGWPRTSRVYTHAHVLDIVRRQKSLNFVPGTKWSYCNTGYNLTAIIVTRVSGQPFAEFCRQRIFVPLGMTNTSWRDDFRRIVRGRAIAYDESKDTYRQNMPFENVHGNGGLLTTVGDLLKWNENAVRQKVGDAEFLREELTPGRFNDGTAHNYAMGLYIRTYKGLLPEVSHSGSTAGYRAFLARFPEQHVSVAVLCNAATANAEQYARGVADLYLADALAAKMKAEFGSRNPIANDDRSVTWSTKAHAGLFKNVATGVPLTLVTDGLLLKPSDRPDPMSLLHPIDPTTYRSLDGARTYTFDGEGGALRVANDNGTSEAYERVQPASPTTDELKDLAGTYVSDEAEVEIRVVTEGAELRILRRPDTSLVLRPIYRDAFSAPSMGLVRFRRDQANRVTALSVTADRVWDLRFERR